MTTQKERQFYRPDELADALQIHVRTVYEYIKAERIAAVRIGLRWRISQEEFERIKKIGLAETT